uniref:Uncharacterized protein n=1 Tax=Strigamia maritima TaxID=126957 RepID=T1JJU2_STRMM
MTGYIPEWTHLGHHNVLAETVVETVKMLHLKTNIYWVDNYIQPIPSSHDICGISRFYQFDKCCTLNHTLVKYTILMNTMSFIEDFWEANELAFILFAIVLVILALFCLCGVCSILAFCFIGLEKCFSNPGRRPNRCGINVFRGYRNCRRNTSQDVVVPVVLNIQENDN